MTRIQDFIHSLELGKGATILKGAVGVLVLLTLAAWYDLNEFRNFHTVEAMETAQLARNLARGQGFTTQFVRPLSLHLVQEKQGVEGRLSKQPHPDLATPPVYPLVLAGLMKVVGSVVPLDYEITPRFWQYQPEVIIAIFNQLLLVVTAGLLYRLARRLFDVAVGLVTVCVFFGTELLWRFSVSGLSTGLVMLMLVGLVGLLVRLEEATREGSRGTKWYVGMAVAIGALLGVATLTRYSVGWLLLPVLGFCTFWLKERRMRFGGVMVAVFLVVLTPWLVRNYQVSGTLFGISGFALQQDTLAFPETRLERSLKPDLGKVGLRDYLRKLFGNAGVLVPKELPGLGGSGVVGAFFLVSLMLRFRSVARERLKHFLLASLVLMLVVQALGRTHLSAFSPDVNTENLMVLMLPGILLFGSAFFVGLLDQMELAIEEMRYFGMVVFVAVASSPLVLALLPPRSFPIVYPPYLPPWIQETARLLRPDELMMSDMPWAVAWYGDRQAVWTTLNTRESFYEVYDRQKTISALYLTPITTDARYLTQILQGPDHEWSRFALEVLTRKTIPKQFPLQEARARYAPDQLLICDRARWLEREGRAVVRP